MHATARKLVDDHGASTDAGTAFWKELLLAWRAAFAHLGAWDTRPSILEHPSVESLLASIAPCAGSAGSASFSSAAWPWEVVPSAGPPPATLRTLVTGEPSREEAVGTTDAGTRVEKDAQPVHAVYVGAQLPESWRSAQAHLFSGPVKRDIYEILIHPAHPYETSTASAADTTHITMFEVVIAVKEDAAGQHQAYIFLPRDSSKPCGFKVLQDAYIMQAVSRIGETSPHAYAVTLAFENFLSALAKDKWHVQHTAQLSVEFLVAFGAELTPRLDINNRICTQRLSFEDKQKLSNAPYAAYVDQAILQSFQQ